MTDETKARARLFVLLAAVLAAGGMLFAYRYRAAAGESGERDMGIGLLCQACGHTYSTSIEKMVDLSVEGRAKGFKEVGTSMDGPVAVCPKCNKPAVFRSGRCPKCGKPVLFAEGKLGDRVVVPECKCGWKASR